MPLADSRTSPLGRTFGGRGTCARGSSNDCRRNSDGLGQVVDGKYRLGEFIGETDHSAVFLTEARQPEVRKAAIKLIPADAVEAKGQLGRWRQAAKLSHPNLTANF